MGYGEKDIEMASSINFAQTEGIALDWVTKTLYWTDSDLRHIAVYGILNGHQIVLHRTANNSTPRAIVVDPSTR